MSAVLYYLIVCASSPVPGLCDIRLLLLLLLLTLFCGTWLQIDQQRGRGSEAMRRLHALDALQRCMQA